MIPGILIGLTCLFSVLLILSALLSALETAIASLREFHLNALVKREPDLEAAVTEIVKRPRRSLNQVILALSVTNLLLATLGLLLIREGAFFIGDSVVTSALVLLALIVVIGDLLPKLIALADPARAFRLTVRPFQMIEPLTKGPADWLTGIAEKFSLRLLSRSETERLASFSDEEVETLVEMRRDEGTLLDSESGMIQEIIRLGNKTAKDCMTPRVDAFLLSDSLTAEEVRDEVVSRRKWRAPVYDGSPDKVTGVLDIRKWLYEPDRDFRDFVDEACFVPEMMPAMDVFREILSKPRSLAVVVDEYGGVEGVLTHSDLIEEILADEAPLRGQTSEIRLLPDGILQVHGGARLEEIADFLPGGMGSALKCEGLGTIGGLIFTTLGRVPLPGTQIDLLPNLIAIVRQNRGNRIVEVLLRPLDTEGGES